MSTLPLTWMADAFRENGLTVKEVKGWKTAGRPFMFAPRGVVFHHTASNPARGAAPALGTVVNGRSDLPGPLCNVLVARDSTVYTVAAGYANHAGLGGPFKSIPQDSGNRYMAGVEVENNGVGEKWSEELLETCAHVFATLLIGFRRRESWLCGHKEWAPTRKIDPSLPDMAAYRRRVKRVIGEIARPQKAKKPRPPKGAEPGGDLEPTVPGELPEATYVVQDGDTLWRIAHEHRMSVDELRELNGLTSDLIKIGDELRVRA
jgi:hypothetical protein